MTLLYKNDGFIPLESIPDNYKMTKNDEKLKLSREGENVEFGLGN